MPSIYAQMFKLLYIQYVAKVFYYMRFVKFAVLKN